MNKYLIKLANHLDKKGLHKEADYVDWILRKRAEDGMTGLSGNDIIILKQALNDVMATEIIKESYFLGPKKDIGISPEEFANFTDACQTIKTIGVDSYDNIKFECYKKDNNDCIKMTLTKGAIKYQFEICAKESIQKDESRKHTLSFESLGNIVEDTDGSGF